MFLECQFEMKENNRVYIGGNKKTTTTAIKNYQDYPISWKNKIKLKSSKSEII